MQPTLTIFYQMDPLNVSIGGIQTTIINLIKYAPREFNVRLVGITARRDCTISKWKIIEVDQRKINSLALFCLKNDNIWNLIPKILKYSFSLFLKNFNSNFLHFHRIEPPLASFHWCEEKTHANIQKKINRLDANNAILWRSCPVAYFVLECFLLKQFSQVWLCSSESLKYCKGSYLSLGNKFRLICKTVDDEIFFPSPEKQKVQKRSHLAQKTGLLAQTCFMSFIGRLDPQKEPLLLVRSAEFLKISEPLVLTSAYEGLPMIALEAITCGIPVVATGVGETPVLLSHDTGGVSRECTPIAIANALSIVLKNPQSFPSQACV